MNFQRTCGILLHPTSLPGGCGIGDLGNESYRFADFLKDSGQHLWQMLPINPTGYGNSPYQCTSVFAGNPLLISIEKLIDSNLLDKADLLTQIAFPEHVVDFDAVSSFKLPLLAKAYLNFLKYSNITFKENFSRFCRDNADWMDDFALFMAYKNSHQFTAWNTWPEDIRFRRNDAITHWQKQLEEDINNQKFQQYLFFVQWSEFKKYCNSHEIKLIGDIPIFVSMDSDAVWSHPEYFYLNKDGTPEIVAGVPPDYFSATGQLWGNPLYNWDELKKDGYSWWAKRFKMILSLFDMVRIDHFRGFESYWEIPGNASTAANGRWVKGPGITLFKAVQDTFGTLPIIAEDLGIITDEVETLRNQLGFPGMKVLQFAFGDDNYRNNKYLPENYTHNYVVYTGTHDNNTTIGWFNDDSATTLSTEDRLKEKQRALNYLGTDGHEINWDFIRIAYKSVADMAIIPVQDILGLGSEARMNIPGTTGNNWRWRLRQNMLTNDIKVRLKQMAIQHNR